MSRHLPTRLLFLALFGLVIAPLAGAQEGAPSDAMTGRNEALAVELETLLWRDGSNLNWRHWSGERGVEIFHDNNDGRMRSRHMRHIRGNPSADNMMVAGPGFYIASDISSSAYFGEELLDVKLSERARLIDLTNAETKSSLREIFSRHGVTYPLASSGDLRKVELLDLLTRHGVNGARYSSSIGDWTTLWDHSAIGSLRRGSSNVHVEMWGRFDTRLESAWGEADPVSRANADGALKKLAAYRSDAELRAFAAARELRAGEGAAPERFGEAFRELGVELEVERGERRLSIENDRVRVRLPAAASYATTARAYFEARAAKELFERAPEVARRAFAETGERGHAESFLLENARLRAARMVEGLMHADAEASASLASERAAIERRAARARMEVGEVERLRATVKEAHGVDLPPTRAERVVSALPEEFDLRRFHVEAEVYYEERRSVREAFGRRSEVRRLRENLRNGRGLLDGVAAERLFVVEGEGALNSLYERYEIGPDASRAEIDRFLEEMRRRGALVERVARGDPRLPTNGQGRTLVTEDGRVKVLLPADRAIKKAALIDELTHVRQFGRMIESAGAGELRALLERSARGDPLAREVLLRWELKARKNVLVNLDSRDPTRRLVEDSIRALEQSRDPYVTSRRASGRIDWRKATASTAGGLLHFSLALFLKELAVVVETGDQRAITEFFDGLLTTDFYLNYGLFSAGAQAGNLIYTKAMERTLTRYIRPRFVNSVLKSNVVLAAGMALPQLVSGHFNGKAFAIEVAGLGLSSMAVKGGVESLRWVASLRKVSGGVKTAERIGKLARLAKVGGWVYSAVELAVVLYFGEKITRAINEELAAREALAELHEAIDRFRAVLAASPDEGRAEAAIRELKDAYVTYRNFLYEPLRHHEAALLARLEKISHKVGGELRGLERYEELAARDPARFGALRRHAELLKTRLERDNQAEVEAVFARYEREHASLLSSIYRGESGGTFVSAFAGADHWGFRGAPVGAAGDPLSGRTDLYARYARSRARSDFESRLHRAPGHRLEAYSDEMRLLELAAASAGDQEVAEVLRTAALATVQLRDQERALVLGEGPLVGSANADPGLDPAEDALGLVRALAGAREGEGPAAETNGR